ncbi:MAG TPA: hypothetical protein VKH19_16705 [Gemmatimonadaceae bacterium]|nr:hypothetical protein [Gemmatimonadaceae bacterium]
MKKPAAALLALLAVACLSATEADDLLVVSIATDRTTLATGDTAHLVIALVNHADQSVTAPQASCGPYFFVRDSLGRAFAPPQSVCPTMTPPTFAIAAHDSVLLGARWAGEARTATGGVDRLDPGSYSVYAVLLGTHRPVQSRSVAIKLLP